LKIKLNNISSIQTGIYAKPDISGEVLYIQARHFDSNGLFNSTVRPDLKHDKKLEKHLLKPGDILFAAKGSNNFAVLYQSAIGAAVASSMFFIIRIIDQQKIEPEYLRWYLNHPNSINFLKGKSKGTSLPSISKDDLGDLDIIIPSLKTQETIVKINDLQKQKRRIFEKLEKLKDYTIQQKLFRAIRN